MKLIEIPYDVMRRAAETVFPGRAVEIPVEVNWFPCRTEAQIVENAIAMAAGKRPPHPNPNFITVRIPVVFREWDFDGHH